MSLKNLIKKIGVFAFTFSIMTNTVFAADTNNIRIHNINSFPNETIKQIDNVISLLPDSVVNYYNECGGDVYLINGPLTRDGVLSPDILGLYYFNTSDIYIRADNEIVNNPSHSLINSTLHEFGHFLYTKLYSLLSDESKQTLTNNYNYYSKYNGRCYNENETFAEMYSWYRGNMSDVDDKTISLYQEAEYICKTLYDLDVTEIGPGTINQIKESLKIE